MKKEPVPSFADLVDVILGPITSPEHHASRVATETAALVVTMTRDAMRTAVDVAAAFPNYTPEHQEQVRLAQEFAADVLAWARAFIPTRAQLATKPKPNALQCDACGAEEAQPGSPYPTKHRDACPEACGSCHRRAKTSPGGVCVFCGGQS